MAAARDLGRRYAAVSGDHNPIHLYPLTARALGFRRQIAHGMWTKARSIAAIENRLPDVVTVAVAFRKPVFLPGTVAFADTVDEGVHTFALTDPRPPRRTCSVGNARLTRVSGGAARTQRSRRRIRPSCATVATRGPFLVNTRAAEPTPTDGRGDPWS